MELELHCINRYGMERRVRAAAAAAAAEKKAVSEPAARPKSNDPAKSQTISFLLSNNKVE